MLWSVPSCRDICPALFLTSRPLQSTKDRLKRTPPAGELDQKESCGAAQLEAVWDTNLILGSCPE